MRMAKRVRTRPYRVEVVRSGSWWAISVPELSGVFSQVKRLDQVEGMAREAIGLALGIPPEDVGGIDPTVIPPPEAAVVLEQLASTTAVAEEAMAHAADLRRHTAALLRDEGLSMRDIGALLGVSHQRVSQILAE